MVKVLLVDDERAITDNLAPFLERTGFAVEVAVDGEDALGKAARFAPDLIVSDILMPRLDGFGVIERLRECPEHCDIPIIVLTAKTLSADERAQLERSVSTVIQKQGLQRETLLRELRTALQAYHPKT